MITVSLTGSGGRLHCVLSRGIVTAEGDSKSVIGVLAKTYARLVIRDFKARTTKWRKIWTER